MKQVILILIIVATGKTDEQNENQCTLSQMEESIKEYKLQEPRIFLPTLKKLKKSYPGDTFKDTKENECSDLEAEAVCKLAAEQGNCNGTNHELEAFHQSSLALEEIPKRLGFHMRDPKDISVYQITEMQKGCRASCKRWAEGVSAEEVPADLKVSGVYEDVFKDVFGLDIKICDMNEGFTTTAVERILSMLANNVQQPKLIPQFHRVGFEKSKIPKDIYAQILTNRKKLLNNKKKWTIEYCVPGMQNCNRIVESETAQECHEVSRENYFYLPLNQNTLNEIFKNLLPLAESWIDHKIKLIGTTVYGMRKYTRGAKLAGHVDHMETHVVSAILNIRQEVDEEWPLQIFDHDGKLHEIFLKPGEMIWYESAKLVHARAVPLNGSYFENLFVHYMPRSREWYKSDYSAFYGKPVKNYTLEDLREADKEMEEKRARLKNEKLNLELERERQLLSSSLEEKWKLLDIV